MPMITHVFRRGWWVCLACLFGLLTLFSVFPLEAMAAESSDYKIEVYWDGNLLDEEDVEKGLAEWDEETQTYIPVWTVWYTTPDEAEVLPTPRAVFTNTTEKNPDLYVIKNVTPAVEGLDIPKDDWFTFTLKLNGALAKEVEYTVYDAVGTPVKKWVKFNDVTLTYDELSLEEYQNDPDHAIEVPWKTDRNGEFKLKSGWLARFEYVGVGTSYEVSEHPLDNYT